MPTLRRPTRRDLIAVIERLQDLIGEAKAGCNDRNPNKQATVDGALGEALALCIAVRSDDPPCSKAEIDRSERRWPVESLGRT